MNYRKMVSYLTKHPKSDSRELIYDSRFKIEINPYGSSPSPEKAIYFDQNTCVNENPEAKSIDNLDAETCGERLIRNELRPGHWSVLNFADVTLRCFNFPHSAIAQLTRHHEQKFLVQCLTGDTVVSLLNKKGGSSKSQSKTIDELYDLWHNGEKAVRYSPQRGYYRRDMKTRVKKLRVRSLDEDTNYFTENHIKDIFYKGKQPVYKLTLENGNQIKATLNHKFLTESGWQTLGEATNPVLDKDGNVLWLRYDPLFCCNGITDTQFKKGQKPWNDRPDALYRDKDWLTEQLASGASTREIAHLADCSQECVKKWVYRFGLELNRYAGLLGHTPWNKGLKDSYKLNLTPEQKQQRRERAKQYTLRGEKSPFWRGGTSTERDKIANWTISVAEDVHHKHNYTCQNCGKTECNLEAHHIVPVFIDESEAYNFDNLASVCPDCHNLIHWESREEEFSKKIGVGDDNPNWNKKAKRAGGKLRPHYVKVKSLEYVGVQDTYDIEMEEPHHNFVANKIVVHNSGRYTGKRFMEWDGSLAGVEDLVYLRPTGCYTTRSGDRYVYDEKSRQGDLELLQVVLKHYQKRVQEGMPYEQARGCMAYDFRQSFSIRGSIKNWFHLLDQRTLADSQLEAQSFAYMALEVLRGYSPSLFDFYFNNRAGKNKLAP